MPQVPPHSRTRHTHSRTKRLSHAHSGFLAPMLITDGTLSQGQEDEADQIPFTPPVYPEGSIPPSAVDHTPPAVPTGLALTSDVGPDADNHQVLRLKVSLTQPSDTDLFGTYVEITADNDGNPDPNLQVPVWTNALVLLVGAESSTASVEGVRGLTKYWARARAVDTFNNYSDFTATVSTTTLADAEAPGMPQNFVVTAGFRGFATRWDATSARDLMFNELRYAPDNGTGSAPDTGQWAYVRVRTNVIWVGGLTPDQKYWVQVRAVDFSGNVVTSESDATAVNYLAFPEAGWTAQASVTPSQVGSADIAANTITSTMISTAGLSADVIKAGLLKLNVADASMADGVEVWNAGVRIGKWDETGLYVYRATDTTDYVKVYDGGITVYLDGVAQTAITPEGINATALNFGALPGGHNIVQNSSFELADFVAAASTKTWDATADFTGTDITSVNVTNTNDVHMTAVSY